MMNDMSASTEKSERDRESSPESDTVDIELMENLQCKWGACVQSVFKTEEMLIAHVKKVHVGPLVKSKPASYNCEWRNCLGKLRSFRVPYKLRSHVQQHTGEKPHKCPKPGCPKAFSSAVGLNSHLNFHAGKNPYKCKECDQWFRSTNNRAKHVKGKHRKAGRLCGYQGCKETYADTSAVRKHVKQVHGAKAWETRKLKKELKETGGRWQKKIENKKKDCGSEDRESSHGPDSGGHLPENPGRVETVGMYDPNHEPNREGETNVANGNGRPINGPGFTGYLTADVVNEETVELGAIEMGLSEARREDIYRNANFVPFHEQTGHIPVATHEAYEASILRCDDRMRQPRFEYQLLTPTPRPIMSVAPSRIISMALPRSQIPAHSSSQEVYVEVNLLPFHQGPIMGSDSAPRRTFYAPCHGLPGSQIPAHSSSQEVHPQVNLLLFHQG